MDASFDSLPACLRDERLIGRLHARAEAARWGISAERFAQALVGAVASRFPGLVAPAVATPQVITPPVITHASIASRSTASSVVGSNLVAPASDSEPRPSLQPQSAPDITALERFLDGLHLQDLALAVGCAEGDEGAWEAFVASHRTELRRAAVAIAGADQGAELADALLGELFGVDARGDTRRSLFHYFHGRSRLSTWGRAILAQRYVDQVRAGRRMVSLDAAEEADDLLPVPAPASMPPDPDRARLVGALQRALDVALASLDANERLRLVCYHVDGMTLAEMGRLFREHEATASRKLQRIRGRVRVSTMEYLRREGGLQEAQIALCVEYALQDGSVDLRALTLPGVERPSVTAGSGDCDGRSGKKSAGDRSKV